MSWPAFHGNWVDLLIVVFLVFYAWEGFERGFLVLVGEMASFVVAFVAALRFYPVAARVLTDNFSLSLEFAKALGFVLTAVAIEAVLGILLGEIFRRMPMGWFAGRWNRLFGFIPALVDGLILVGFLATVLVGLPISGVVKNDILNSRIASGLVSQTRGLEKTLNGVFGGAIQQTLSFLTVTSGSRESVDLHFRTNNFTVDASSEQTMLSLVNQERTTRGLRPLEADAKLQEAAREHSRDMFLRGYFSHVTPDGKDPFERMREAGLVFEAAGENIAYAPSVAIVHEGLMNSEGHRGNILNTQFNKIGIGVIDGGIYGKMFAQDFTN